MMQIVELSPIHPAKKLLNHAMQHGAPPHQRFVAGIQKPHGHYLDAMFLNRLNAFAQRMRRGAHAHHERNVRAVNIRIH